jgi:hypothetical protein
MFRPSVLKRRDMIAIQWFWLAELNIGFNEIADLVD